jgi:putative colanic acid biosynthesis UDP-glucose lipid carrier transferase
MFASKHLGLLSHYNWLVLRIQQVLDGLVILSTLYLFSFVYDIEFQSDYSFLAAIAFCLSLLIFSLVNLYQPWRGARLGRLASRIFIAWVLVVAILTTLGFLTKRTPLYSRKLLLTWMAAAPLALVALRLVVYRILGWIRAHGYNSRTLVIGGAGNLGKTLAENILQVRSLGINILGFFDDFLAVQEIRLGPQETPFKVLGDLKDMVDFVRREKIDMVYLALPFRAENRLREIIDALQYTTASVYLAPDIFIFSLLQAGFTDLKGIPLVSLWETPFFGINGWLKRAEDLILGSLIILCVTPVLVLIALGIKLTSPGPVIFKQRRWGLNGEEIQIYKFRTMTVIEDGHEVIRQTSKDDERITKFGTFLRRTSLDELPQFFNVILGSMSIVGPRPHVISYNEYYESRIPGYMIRHKVRPGITGWAQVNGLRGGNDFKEMEKRVQYDLDYFRRWSLWFDLKIIFYSIFIIFTDKKAY